MTDLTNKGRFTLAKNIFTAFFPNWTIALLALALGLRFVNIHPNYIVLSDFIISVLLFVWSMGLVTIPIHELGHLLMAKLVKGKPLRIQLGRGQTLFKGQILGVKVSLKHKIDSGLAFASFSNISHLRLRLAVYILGGVFFNLALAGCIYYFKGFDWDRLIGKEGIDLLMILMTANALRGAMNLIPFTTYAMDSVHGSDGYQLLSLPFRKKEDLEIYNYSDKLLDAAEFAEEGKYDQALSIYLEYLERFPNENLLKYGISHFYLKLGELDKSLELLLELEELLKTDKKVKRAEAILYNALAWTYLLKNELEKAEEYSKKAILIAPKSDAIRGTRAAVLVELERIEGKHILQDLIDLKYVNDAMLINATYLAYAFYLQEKPEKMNKYLEYVGEHQQHFHLDGRMLYERILERIGEKEKLTV
ncbi:tetratricopeptide repeat protein [Sediminitomix flava]|uniref:Tetratricopeptide repeat protein n=1 Tax=Sediminitomix flava TaxID=379075 RepID=A0A316A475_SEDFL|nr:tetratricopeptide repeat protein [Sediminitomix flava]PWJ44537.1 tetratricopeptide repeat protein [Sediminitomix flava]